MDQYAIDRLLRTAGIANQDFDLTRPVSPKILEECIDIALHAPTSANQQHWHFVVVTDPDKRVAIANLYRKAVFSELGDLAEVVNNALSPGLDSIRYLVHHLHEMPVLVIPCITWRAAENAGTYVQADLYASILPAAWSLMMALHVRGLSAFWTTWHLMYETEVAQLLDIPAHVTQVLMLPIAYCTRQKSRPIQRARGQAVTSWNRWGVQCDAQNSGEMTTTQAS